jgi:predicted ATPase
LKIKSLHIKNFKSIGGITIDNPNPFTVFVGANGSGKSNIFEALEFLILSYTLNSAVELFGGESSFLNKNFFLKSSNEFKLEIEIEEEFGIFRREINISKPTDIRFKAHGLSKETIEKFETFSHIFVGNTKIQKLNINDNSKVSTSGSNLEKVLKRILEDEFKREEISDWLSLFIPEFDRIEVKGREHSSKEDLFLYQKNYSEPFEKDLISDGTFNIIAILTAVFQSDEPQFLCIEEPENGLNPKVVKELVNLFRDACEQYGHYIWINTHSQTLVSQLKEEELIIVDKIKGETKIKQFKKGAFYGMPADEALLTNTLGGGNPW